MKLINTTNSHSQLVKSQLESTDATLVEVYSAGNTDVIFTQAPLHYEILISNKHRAIRESEIEAIQDFFLRRKINKDSIDEANIKTLYSEKLIGNFEFQPNKKIGEIKKLFEPCETKLGLFCFLNHLQFFYLKILSYTIFIGN